MMSARHNSSAQEASALLNCRRLPARLNVTEVAVLLGFKEHDIAPLISAKLLNPLGKPASNAPKYFATVEIVARAENVSWLIEATKALAKHWMKKNRRYEEGKLTFNDS
jgi:hypothetical protein